MMKQCEFCREYFSSRKYTKHMNECVAMDYKKTNIGMPY